MNRSKLKLTTIIALTAFTVAVIPACLQRKSANAASKYTYKKGFTYEKISPNIEKRITGKSYRKNNNIKLSDLRYVQVLHYGFDGNDETFQPFLWNGYRYQSKDQSVGQRK